jgi:protein gp37
MSDKTPIEWCDSAINLEMGCDGCELWDRARRVRHCYAGVLTEKWAGRKGWPKSFDKPELFTERLDQDALRWRDLSGKSRPVKPWLDGYPRLVFVNDMGDTFTESLPVDWLLPLVPRMGESPHVWIALTKRPGRMLEWARLCRSLPPAAGRRVGGVPPNFWLCVSLTGKASLGRLDAFRRLRAELPGHVLGLSVEPLLADLAPLLRRRHPDLPQLVSWVKVGGESNQRDAPARPCDLTWVRGVRDFFGSRVPVFVKQLGGRPVDGGNALRLRDRDHGGDWREWPEDLRVRQMPLTTTARRRDRDT